MLRMLSFALMIYGMTIIPAMAAGRTNAYPIIFVHGFGGWAPGEQGTFNYWGGETDLVAELRRRGHDVRVAAVSPVGSNWDRACELYAIIKGGQVDYGQAHSGAAGHPPTTSAKSFSGLYPQWGERQHDGTVNKIHLVGHSMGGQTIRLLTQLLEHGAPHEQQYAALTGARLSPLFAGGEETKGWVESVTTISAPHDGNTLIYKFEEMAPHLGRLVAFLTARGPIDLMIEQWDLTQEPGENSVAYFFRAVNELGTTWDSGLFDLTPYGAAFFNGQAQAQPGVYYFSYSTNATHPAGNQYEDPLPVVTQSLVVPSQAMGRLTGTINGLTFDESWWPNDGMVPTASQNGPTLNSADHIVAYNPGKGPLRGVWNDLGTLRATDHYAIVGITENETTNWPKERLVGFYDKLARMLSGLPAD